MMRAIAGSGAAFQLCIIFAEQTQRECKVEGPEDSMHTPACLVSTPMVSSLFDESPSVLCVIRA